MAALVSAAQRRKQRRLRSWWRHEQQSIAAVLATVSHHSYSKVDTANAALREQKIDTSTEVGPAEFLELFSDDGRPTGWERPAALLEPRPQGEVQRHAGIGFELAQNLDVPVLHMVDVLQFFATCLPVVAEQVIDVPKISLDRTQHRLGDCLRQPQMADQLVEVPTIISFSSLQRIVEQNLDIPVQRGGGRSLQGFRPGQGSTARTVEQTVDIPVPHSRGGRGMAAFKVRDRVQQRVLWSRPLTFRFLAVEVFKVSSQDRVQRLRPLPRTFVLVLWMSRFKGFSHFSPVEKKCGYGSALGVGTGCGLYSMDCFLCRVHGVRRRRV